MIRAVFFWILYRFSRVIAHPAGTRFSSAEKILATWMRMNLLSELNKEGTTIVMVTHSKHDAEFAHRIINLFDGMIVSQTGNTF